MIAISGPIGGLGIVTANASGIQAGEGVAIVGYIAVVALGLLAIRVVRR